MRDFAEIFISRYFWRNNRLGLSLGLPRFFRDPTNFKIFDGFAQKSQFRVFGIIFSEKIPKAKFDAPIWNPWDWGFEQNSLNFFENAFDQCLNSELTFNFFFFVENFSVAASRAVMIIFQTADFTLYRVERKAFVPNFAIATLGDVAQIVHRPTFRLEDRLEY